jgi:hypothetical protein
MSIGVVSWLYCIFWLIKTGEAKDEERQLLSVLLTSSSRRANDF